VQQQIREVIAARIQTEELVIQHERQPRHRMPEAGLCARHRPFQVFQGQPLADLNVIGHIDVVVVKNEVIMLNVPIDRQDKNGQEKENVAFAIEFCFDGRSFLLRSFDQILNY